MPSNKDLWWESPASCAKRMHSRARLRKVSGLIRISSGPGKHRRGLRQNSAAISASLGFSTMTSRGGAERRSTALPRIIQHIPTDDRQVPGSHARRRIEASPFGPAAYLTSALGRLPHRRRLRVVPRPEVPQRLEEPALILRRTFTRHPPLCVTHHSPPLPLPEMSPPQARGAAEVERIAALRSSGIGS